MASPRFYAPPGARVRPTAVPSASAADRVVAAPARTYPRFPRPRGAGRRYVAARTREAMRGQGGSPLPPFVVGDHQPTTEIDLAAIFRPTGRRLGDDLARVRNAAPVAAPPPPPLAAEGVRSSRRPPRATADGAPTVPPPLPAPATIRAPSAPRRPRPAARRRRPLRRYVVAAGAAGAALAVVALVLLLVSPLRTGIDAWRDVFEEPTPPAEVPAIVAFDALGALTLPTLVPEGSVAAGEAPWSGNAPTTILLVGVDRRDDRPAHADTIVLLRVDGEARTARLLALPRATRVIVPGRGVHTLGGAWAIGDSTGNGAALLEATIEANFGVTIDHVATVDFDGFVALVDEVGGIVIDNPFTIKDDAYPTADGGLTRVFIPAGWQRLDADEALVYVRTRNDDGDAMRAQRQLQVLIAIRDQALRLDLLPQAEEIIGQVSAAIRTDLQPAEMLELARIAVDVPREAITHTSLQSAAASTTADGTLILDWGLVAEALTVFTGDAIMPPVAALASPNLDTPILLRDASGTGLVAVAVARLTAAGFRNVRVDAEMAVVLATSVVVDGAGDLATATLAANVVGPGAVALAGLDATVGGAPIGPLADANRAIVIIVGQDVPPAITGDIDDFDALAGAVPPARDVGRLVPPPVLGGEIGSMAIVVVDLALPATGERSENGPRSGYGTAGDASGGPDPDGDALDAAD